jgi:hypothetical protein
MATTGTGSPSAIQKKIDALEAGTTKDIVGRATVMVAGTAMTAAQILAKLGAVDTLYTAVVAARSTLKQALAAYEAVLPGIRLFIKSYEAALKGQFGVDNVQLQDFGINPVTKKATRTAAEKAVSTALATNTRAVRGPTGKARAAVTTQGKPGLVLVGPTGTPISSALPGPTPPGAAEPVDAAATLAPVTPPGGNAPSGGGTPTPGK